MTVTSTDEIREYFFGFDELNEADRFYVVENLKLWAVSGLLHVVVSHEGHAELGEHSNCDTDAKQAAATITRNQLVTNASLFQQFGPLGLFNKRSSNDIEVRLNLPVAHGFAHQLRYELAGDPWNNLLNIYHRRIQRCAERHQHIPPNSSEPEHLTDEQIATRCFISARARTSPGEFWAECVAAFSTKNGRQALREIDPDMYGLLLKVVAQPERVLNEQSVKELHEFQATMDLQELVADIANL